MGFSIRFSYPGLENFEEKKNFSSKNLHKEIGKKKSCVTCDH